MTRQIVRFLLPRPVRNWLRSPGRSVHYIADRLAFYMGASPKVSPAGEWFVRCHPAARHHFEVFRLDPVQEEELKAFADHCKPGMHLLDIGAHYGFFALACLHYAGPDSRVLCVEASPKAADVLRANLTLNHATNQVAVSNCAMGDGDGDLQMLATGPLGGDYFVIPTEDRSDTVRVPQRTIASLLKETGFEPTHIKMDIESFEFEVLAAAENVLKTCPVLFLEIHGDQLKARDKDPREIIRLLRRIGYRTLLLGNKNVEMEEIEAHNYNCRLVCLP